MNVRKLLKRARKIIYASTALTVLVLAIYGYMIGKPLWVVILGIGLGLYYVARAITV